MAKTNEKTKLSHLKFIYMTLLYNSEVHQMKTREGVCLKTMHVKWKKKYLKCWQSYSIMQPSGLFVDLSIYSMCLLNFRLSTRHV